MFALKRYAYEVCRQKSFSGAAHSLYITQPALSAAIRRLEERIGMPLFDRSTTPVSLTDCGMRYMLAAEAIMAVEQAFADYLADVRQLQTGTLVIGGSNLFTSYVVPPLAAALHERFPNVRITLVEDSTRQLTAKLLAGDLDFLVDNGTLDETQYAAYPWREEQLLLAVPREYAENSGLEDFAVPADSIRSGSPLGPETPCVPLERFRNCPFVFLKPPNDTHIRGMQLCRNHGFEPRVLFELDQQATAYNIAASGMGACFVSDTLVRSAAPQPGLCYYLPDRDAGRRPICFYTRRNMPVTFAMDAWLKLLGQTGSSAC